MPKVIDCTPPPAHEHSLPDQTATSFLDLPAELRNVIYRMVLPEEAEIDVSALSRPKEPGLLAACRQIRDEGLDVYYGENQFVYYPLFRMQRLGGQLVDDDRWIRSIGELRGRRIRHLRLGLGVHEELKNGLCHIDKYSVSGTGRRHVLSATAAGVNYAAITFSTSGRGRWSAQWETWRSWYKAGGEQALIKVIMKEMG